MEGSASGTRGNEWFVPKRGPRLLRQLLGMTFLPYTLMNASYTIIGSLLAPSFNLFRAGLLAMVYLLAVGISAHALDARAPNKPWGAFLSRGQLLALALIALAPALTIGLYLAFSFSYLLLPVGVLELFFLLSYNLELFGGVFHTDLWFSLSWGFLPVVAGYVLQANSVSLVCIGGGVFGFGTAYVEISASRPYKEIKRLGGESDNVFAKKFESILKGIVATVLVLTVALFFFRMTA